MINRIKQLMVAAMMVVSFGAGMVALSPSAHAAGKCSSSFLTFPAWYDGLTDGNCRLKSPSKLGGNEETKLTRYIFRIVLNVLEIALQLVAYISAGFIIYGGFKYLTVASDANKITAARTTIQNAVVGLVLSFLSIAIVTLIAGNIK